MADGIGLSVGASALRAVAVGRSAVTRTPVLTRYPHRPPEVGVPSENPNLTERGLIITDYVDRVGDPVAIVASDGSSHRAETLVGLAGSVTTVAGIALALPEYDSTRIHHARLTAEQVAEVTARLLATSHEERAAIPVLHPGRVDVIAAGSLVLQTIMERVGAREVVVSEHDILDGIAWSVLG